MNFSAEISLDKSESNNDQLINPTIDIGWNRRAYNINLFYNLDSEVGGINFKINTFNFKGLGRKFLSRSIATFTERKPGFVIKARVLVKNHRSKRLFKRCGFVVSSIRDKIVYYTLKKGNNVDK